MDNTKLKSAISRIMSDLIKLDNLITASELEFLDRVYQKYNVAVQDCKMGFYMTLAEAIDVVSSESNKFLKEFHLLMQEGSTADGSCSRPEALLQLAFAYSCGLSNNGSGRVYSFESKGIPLHRDQLIYVSREDRFDKSYLSDEDNYEDINNIARLSGFELVYVPKIAKHFDTYQKTDILRKVLTLVRPTLDRSEDELIRQLRAMTPYKFCTTILERRMKMKMEFDSPCWLIKLGGSQVDGKEYSNFLLLKIDQDHLKKQLKRFMSELLIMQPEHTVSVSVAEEDPNIFRYGGFIKSILDMISLGTDNRWDVVIRLKRCKEFRDGDGKTQKAAISIRRGEEEWPLIGPDRDAAFYALILLCTAENPGGVYLSRDLPRGNYVQRRYEEIYSQMSSRSDEGGCPDIGLSDTRRPIVSRINYAIDPERNNKRRENKSKLMDGTKYLTERDLYLISKSQSKFFSAINPSNVFVRYVAEGRTVEKGLRESSLYTAIQKIK